jgi:hypothetical protein
VNGQYTGHYFTIDRLPSNASGYKSSFYKY